MFTFTNKEAKRVVRANFFGIIQNMKSSPITKPSFEPLNSVETLKTKQLGLINKKLFTKKGKILKAPSGDQVYKIKLDPIMMNINFDIRVQLEILPGSTSRLDFACF